jgi:hypothetical protein
VKLDKTAPSITANRTPLANAFGWNNTSVTADYTASDALSGLDAPATGSHLFASEGAGQSHTFTVTDKAGNSASATVSDVNIDLTAPSATANVSPAANANGWHKVDVTVSFTGADALSGIDTCDAAVVLTGEGMGQSAAGICTDKAGNPSPTATATGINIDKTAPSISASRSPLANAFGWNNSNVTASYAASDALSGLDAPPPTNYVFGGEGAGQLYTFTVTDKAGNSASATVSGVNIDKTNPTLAPTVSPNPVLLNGSATATPNATDALSGVNTQSCAAVATGTVGAQTVACTATDKAGNTANANGA